MLTRQQQLSEYTHIEAELDFITFEELLSHIEHVICRVIDLILDNPIAAAKIHEFNPGFSKPARPFLRMTYTEAIEWLQKRGIKTGEDKDHVFGDDM